MKRLRALVCLPVGALFWWVLFAGSYRQAAAQTFPGRAEVRAITGTASYITNGGPARLLQTGNLLPPGTVIKTDAGSTVDLFLGTTAGLIRVGEKSTLKLDTLNIIETGADTAIEVEVALPDGEMYFNVNKMSKGSRYEIKMPTGVAGIRGTKGLFSFRPAGGLKPPVVLLTGSVLFTHTPAAGPQSVFLMNTPPPVYFSPTEGVKVAPQELVDEVEQVLKDLGTRFGTINNRGPRNFPRNPPVEPFMSPGSGARPRSFRGNQGG